MHGDKEAGVHLVQFVGVAAVDRIKDFIVGKYSRHSMVGIRVYKIIIFLASLFMGDCGRNYSVSGIG